MWVWCFVIEEKRFRKYFRKNHCINDCKLLTDSLDYAQCLPLPATYQCPNLFLVRFLLCIVVEYQCDGSDPRESYRQCRFSDEICEETNLGEFTIVPKSHYG